MATLNRSGKRAQPVFPAGPGNNSTGGRKGSVVQGGTFPAGDGADSVNRTEYHKSYAEGVRQTFRPSKGKVRG